MRMCDRHTEDVSGDGIAAGWFPTRRRGTLRWWDGVRWTERILVRGRETTLAADSASVRRQLLVGEVVLAGSRATQRDVVLATAVIAKAVLQLKRAK